MPAFDRRTVHQTLAEAEGITTESIEIDGTTNKVVLVRLKK